MHQFAVFAEHSDCNKSMESGSGPYDGWNTRVFNRTEVEPTSGNIRLEPGTGTVILKQGIYHITAVSIVSYVDPVEPGDENPGGGVPSRNPAFGGYCRLRDETRPGCETSAGCLNENTVAVGTMSSANMLPSLIDTYLRVDKPEARLILEHQVGPIVEGINLEIFVVNSTWHVMARISIARLGDAILENPVKPVDARISSQLPKPGARTSAINRVFNAALGELLDEQSGMRYRSLYKQYIGIEPRFSPKSSDCDLWVDDGDSELQALLTRGVLRFGYTVGAPYVYWEDRKRTGLDHDLGMALTEIISRRYCGGDAHRLRAEWRELALPPGDEQSGKLAVLCQGLADGAFDIALTGQMMLPSDYLPKGYEVEWTAPTALLFTGITYNGRDHQALDLPQMEAIRSSTLADFLSYAQAESQRLQLELRVFAVTNPGPSPGSAMNIVSEINRGKGRAVWDIGDVSRSNDVMWSAIDHFSVGDSLATGAGTLNPRFRGLYLNIPANLEKDEDGTEYVGLWPIAGFTATRRKA